MPPPELSLDKGGIAAPRGRSGNGCLECLATDGKVDELTHRVFVVDHQLEIGNKISRICNVIGVIATTVEGDNNLTILNIGDVVDCGRFEFEHDNKKGYGLS